MDIIKESVPEYNHRQINEHNNDTENTFKIKVDSTELDTLLETMKKVEVLLDKIHKSLDKLN